MDQEKINFLKNRFVPLLEQIPSDRTPQWGKMTLQQMIEHFTEVLRIASGKIPFSDTVTARENLPKMRAFMMSDKPFRENTSNPLLPEIPAPVKNPSVALAIAELQHELDYFFLVFEKNNMQITKNPIFGDLNFEENVQLLYKHGQHHLRQFGVVI